MYVFRLGARRQIHFRLHSAEAVARVRHLAGGAVDSVPHGDTIAPLLGRVAPEELQKIPVAMVRALLEARRLEKFRLLDRYYLLAADMSGHLYLGDRASGFTPGCLTQTAEDGRTLFYRPVCEAKLVTRTGLALSVGSEFVENVPRKGQSDEPYKQDGEQKAMRRLLPRVKKAFPGLAFCLLADTHPSGASSRFVWVTDIQVTRELGQALSNQGGRQRWRIENEGFRTQKHGGFQIGHAYALNPIPAKNFYLLLQVAHILCQMFECYCQGKSVVKHDFGSLRNLAHALLESWRRDPVPEPERLRPFMDQAVQIRLDTS